MKKKALVRKTKSPEPPRSLPPKKYALKPLNFGNASNREGVPKTHNRNPDSIASERSSIKRSRPKAIQDSKSASGLTSRVDSQADEFSSMSNSENMEQAPKIGKRQVRDSKFSLNLGLASNSRVRGSVAVPKNIRFPRNSIVPLPGDSNMPKNLIVWFFWDRFCKFFRIGFWVGFADLSGDLKNLPDNGWDSFGIWQIRGHRS
jgi:hypothetical protein